MSHFHNNMLLGSAGNQGAYEIERSLRFNDDDGGWLSKTFAGDGNLTTWTWSGWVKRSGGLGVIQHLFGWISLSGGNFQHVLGFDANNKLYFLQYNSILGTYLHQQTTAAVYRDTSAWYHVVAVYDTDNTTAGDRVRLYVNGERITSFSTDTTPTSGREGYINDATYQHGIGLAGGGSVSNYFDGYMAEVNFIDGQSLDETDFGETDEDTGAWIPKEYTGSYGTNGFYLNFSDNSDITATTLGKDSSGNGNNWTPSTTFSVTAGADNDSMEDTPTNNWCTLNPLNRGSDNPTVSNGNLYLSSASTDHTVVATFAIPSSGKWYWEYSKTADANLMSGIIHSPETGGLSTYLGGQNNGYSVYATNGQKYTGAIGNQTYMATPSTSTTITIAFDADTNKLYFGADGNWGDGSGNTDETFANAAVAYTVPTGKTYYPAISFNGGNAFANFGQRAFDHTPPAGYKALNTANLPVPTIKKGTDYFDTLIYTGDATARSITGLNFAPDFVWHKARSASDDHRLMDSVRAGGTDLSSAINFSNLETTEASLTGELTQTSNGFDLVATTNFNNNSRTFVAWNWKANGTGSSNTDGSITGAATVSANVDAGFSIVGWAAEATAGTVGHGLGAAPKFIVMKDLDSSSNLWLIYHSELGADKYLRFTTAAPVSEPTAFSTEPTSTVFDPGTGVITGNNYGDMHAYCFAEVEGFSKFGTYEGNTSSNGPYIHTGFSVSWLMVKNIDYGSTNSDWVIHDNKRNPYNVADNHLEANTNNTENGDGRPIDVDFLSNGFKIRTNGSYYENNNSQTYIYMAFAQTPFKYANAR